MIRLVALIAVVVLMLVGLPLVASAQAPSLNWGSQVNPSRCPTDQGYRYLEINVTRKVEGDFALTDALAVPGTAWAAREFNQHIQVWRVGVTSEGERFCALVRYQGSFTAGPSSPKGTPITPGIDGSFEGGYLLLFNAQETTPRYKTQGHIGTFTGTDETPISLYDWRDYYFQTISGSDVLQWWGWIYHGGNNGAWVNAIGGINQGDITD